MMQAPSIKQNLTSSGNETFDKFLGGGLLDGSLNIFRRSGPSSDILDTIINSSFASSSLSLKGTLIYVNFNSALEVDQHNLLTTLPALRKVKSDVLYQDIRDKSAVAKIKIAWRYSQQDSITKVNQVDFGVALTKSVESSELGSLTVINVEEDETLESVTSRISEAVSKLKKPNCPITVIVRDLVHPFSSVKNHNLLKCLYILRCISRTLEKGCILVNYDSSLCDNHLDIEQSLYNLADNVVSFYSYETDENKSTGYSDIDGTVRYTKVPKINSFGFHFQQHLTDWSYRLTKNLRYFVLDELSLPPCGD